MQIRYLLKKPPLWYYLYGVIFKRVKYLPVSKCPFLEAKISGYRRDGDAGRGRIYLLITPKQHRKYNSGRPING